VHLRRQLVIVRSWWRLLLAGPLLAGGVAFVVSGLQPNVYEARAVLVVGQSLTGVNPDYSQLLASQRLSTTYASVATTRSMLRSVIDELGLPDTPDQLGTRVRASAASESALLTIAAQDGDPARAAAIANALAGQLMATSTAVQGREADVQALVDADLQATQDQIESTQEQVKRLSDLASPTPEDAARLQTLQGQLISLRSTFATLLSFSSGSGSNLLMLVDPAVPPVTPISPRPLFNTILAGIVGLALAVAIALAWQILDDTVKSSDDIQAVSELPTLGAIMRMPGDRRVGEVHRLAALVYPRSPAAEAFRTLRTNVGFSAVDEPIRTLLVTSSAPGEGKTVIAANLAVAFAQAGRRVLLVDADLRKPGVHAIFSLANARGLTSLLGNEDEALESVTQTTEQDRLWVVTSGPVPPNPAELLGSQRMRAVIDRLRAGYDLVVFDSPPLNAFADSAILGSLVDGALLVVDAGRSRRGALRQSRKNLANASARVLGAVINRLPERPYATYAAYYQYRGSEEDPEQMSGIEGSTTRSTP
jgi:non-specific protein-tyrosine kinase